MSNYSFYKEYIDKCDEVLNSKNPYLAEQLEEEIVAVFRENFDDITSGLDNYSFDFGSNETDFLGDIKILKGKLLKKAVEFEDQIKPNNEIQKKNKVFISHSGLDVAYVKLVTELFEDIGLTNDELFCSSVPGYGIPLGKDIYEYLNDEFENNNLIVIFVLSDNYYKSAPCLNEMGAAWMKKNDYYTVLLPNFEFASIKGAVNPNRIGIKLDGDLDELKARLGELKDLLISALELKPVLQTKWERNRNDFISKTRNIMNLAKTTDKASEKSIKATISQDAELLLAYACEDKRGTIMLLDYLSKTTLTTAGWNFIGDDLSSRNIARWTAALEELETNSFVIANTKRNIYQITNKGYNYTFKTIKNIDVELSPDEFIKAQNKAEN